MKERLIELLNQEQSRYSEDIADYLLENGVIVLPCKVGDTVYKIVDDCTYGDDCYTKRMCKTCDFRDLHIEPEILSRISDIVQRLSDFGKTVFLTNDEAEKALKERERK